MEMNVLPGRIKSKSINNNCTTYALLEWLIDAGYALLI